MKNLRTIIFFITVLGASPAFVLAQEALPKSAPVPTENKQSPEKVELGKKLYFDPRLSIDGTISCNSCHNIMNGGDDNRPFSAGVKGQLGGRSSPTVFNSAFQSVQFWDGRAATLEEQAVGPMTNPVEMGMPSHALVVERLKKIPGYANAFDAAFGKGTEITIERTAQAIASFERTLITPNSPYDRYVSGDKKALSSRALRGMKTMTDVGCLSCHSGPNFSGPTLPVGVGFFQKFPAFEDNEYVKKYKFKDDLGRFEVTKKEEDKHLFRVPTLRNIALTAPYFHNGSVATLNEAIRVMARTQLNKKITDEQASDIEAFLMALSGKKPKITMPDLPAMEGATLF